jgi:hypothetical protein
MLELSHAHAHINDRFIHQQLRTTDRTAIRILDGWRPHIPTDLVVAQEASDVESSSRLDFLLLHNLRRRFVA